MIFTDIITQVKIDIEQAGTEGLSDTELLDLCLEADMDFCRYTQANEKLSTQVVTAYQSLYSLPTDFLEGRQTRWSYNKQIYPNSERRMTYQVEGWRFLTAAIPTNFVYWNHNAMRLFPIPTAAGTITFRHAYVRSSISTTDSPNAPKPWHSAIIDYVDAQCFYINREYPQAEAAWKSYKEKRSKARAQFKVGQKTPDTLQSMRPKSHFNWQYWNERVT